MLKFRTFDAWDEAVWRQAEPVYTEAFPPSSSKKPSLIRSMLERRLSFLHVLEADGETIGMAVTGKLDGLNALLIDYLAIHSQRRGQGLGRILLQEIERWSSGEQRLQGIVIEVESDETAANERRIRFWLSCGYTLTPYVHKYIWVPEPYKAMYKRLTPDARLPEDGEALFRAITGFHKKAYRG